MPGKLDQFPFPVYRLPSSSWNLRNGEKLLPSILPTDLQCMRSSNMSGICLSMTLYNKRAAQINSSDRIEVCGGGEGQEKGYGPHIIISSIEESL